MFMGDKRDCPTYEQITVPLPQPPGVPDLPSQLFFCVDNRFSTSQKTRIRNLIVTIIGFWQQHYVQKAATGISQLASCTNKYAERKLTPMWFRGIPFTSGADALNYAIDVLTFRFRENGFGKVKTFICYSPIEARPMVVAFARTSDNIKGVSLSVKINPIAIDNLVISNLNLTGSLFHAWLHRCGYTHPSKRDIHLLFSR
ncbi:hypothetical protein ACFRCQ_22485 [Cytobacillus firmus]|uniref:hypothetical protein n=1 Tax=Bacillaceae TaxID=186817 RepID=UPI001A90CA06|nr:hypothetical protein [Bacillus sp. NTK034]MBN8203912.1 hypothetical protein [Bacillus sp. NTK034]